MSDLEQHIAAIIVDRTIRRDVKSEVVSKLLKVAAFDKKQKCPHCDGTGFAKSEQK